MTEFNLENLGKLPLGPLDPARDAERNEIIERVEVRGIEPPTGCWLCSDKGGHGVPCENCGIGHDASACDCKVDATPIKVAEMPAPGTDVRIMQVSPHGQAIIKHEISIEGVIKATNLEPQHADTIRNRFRNYVADLAIVLKDAGEITVKDEQDLEGMQKARAKRLAIRSLRLDVQKTTKMLIDQTKPFVAAVKHLNADITIPCLEEEQRLQIAEDTAARAEKERRENKVAEQRAILDGRHRLIEPLVRNTAIYNLHPDVMNDLEFSELLTDLKRIHNENPPGRNEELQDIAEGLSEVVNEVVGEEVPHLVVPNSGLSDDDDAPLSNSAVDMETDAARLDAYFRGIQGYSTGTAPVMLTEWGKEELDSFYDALANLINSRARRLK